MLLCMAFIYNTKHQLPINLCVFILHMWLCGFSYLLKKMTILAPETYLSDYDLSWFTTTILCSA